MQSTLRSVLLILVLAAVAGTVRADTIVFKNGDRLTGEIVGTEEGKVVIAVPGIGEVRVAADLLAEKVVPAEKPKAEDLETAVEVLAEETEKSPWSAQIDFGALYTSGNTDRLGFNWSFLATREAEDEAFKFRIWGIYTEEDGLRTQNEQHVLLRQDVKFEDWYVFGETHFEKDEFEDLDLRGSLSLGAGCWIERSETRTMMVETAPTLTYEDYEDADAEYKFEWMFGFVGDWKLTEDLKLSEVLRLYPDLSDLPDWRLTSETALETPLADNVFAKLSLIDEYNTGAVGDVERNDFKVLVSVVIRF